MALAMTRRTAAFIAVVCVLLHPARADVKDDASKPALDAQMPPYHFPTGPSYEQLRALSPGAAGAVRQAADGDSKPLPPVPTTPSAAANVTAANSTAANSTAANSTAANSTAADANTTPSSVTGTSAAPADKTTKPTATVLSSAMPFIEPTKSAGVLVCLFVSVALVGYGGLLVWRRILERRYGNREILVNEDQFEHERDLGNFQL